MTLSLINTGHYYIAKLEFKGEVMIEIEHGDVSFTVEKNIIIAKFKGAFNEFGAKKYTDGIKQIVDNFNGERFSILINNLDIIGGTPEAYEELEEYNKWLNNQNLIAKAMVISSVAALEIIDHFSPSRKVQLKQTFQNEKEALDWLKTLS